MLLDERIGKSGRVELTPREWDTLFLELKKISGLSGEYPNPFLSQFGKYGITDPLRSNKNGTIGNRVLYRGSNPFPPALKRNMIRKRKM